MKKSTNSVNFVSMKPIYLFNPENDMALAYGKPHFMMRRSIGKMVDDLSFLPVWYADRGSFVQVDSERRIELFEKYCPVNLGVSFVTGIPSDCNAVRPWGWNHSLCHRLAERGLPAHIFPSRTQMDLIRQLSSRETAVHLLNHFEGHPFLTGAATVLHSAEEATRFVFSHEKSVLKAPWSGSGRGVQFVSPASWNVPIRSWAEHIIRTQHVLIAEPCYMKTLDFAMEFQSEADGNVRFTGYSLFETDDNGAYKRNVLASDKATENRLTKFVPAPVLLFVKEKLEKELSRTIGGIYQGYLGIDMFISGKLLHPCVELDLRMNMGILSRILFARYLADRSTGYLYVEHYPHRGEALSAHHRLQEEHPFLTEHGRIRKGYLPLTPVDEYTSYATYLVME